MITVLASKFKSLSIFLVFSVLIVILIQLQVWPLLVLILYSATAIYVYTFFKTNLSRGEQLYFYGALMILCILSYSGLYEDIGIVDSTTNENVTGKNNFHYFSIVTWTTLGYGDFKPSPEARLYAASQAMLGYAYMSILIAKLFYWLSEPATKTPNKSIKQN